MKQQRKFLCKVGAVPLTDASRVIEETKRKLPPMVYNNTPEDKADLVLALLGHLHSIFGQELSTNVTMNHLKSRQLKSLIGDNFKFASLNGK